MNVTIDLARQAGLRPQADALRSHGRRLSYRELDILTWRAAAWLASMGLRRGDAVALTFLDEFMLAVSLLGAARLGLTFVTLPRSATPHQRRQWASASGCVALVSDAPARFDAGLRALSVTPSDYGAGRSVDRALIDERPAAPLMVNVGSGSTGAPKLIPVSHGNMHFRSRISAGHAAFAEDDRTLWLTGLEFTAVQNRLFNALHAGHALVLPPPAGLPLSEYLAAQRVTVVVASVFHLESILRAEDAATFRAFGALRSVRTGGSSVSESLRRRVVEKLTPNLLIKYATNESGVIAVCEPADLFACPGAVGRPLEASGGRVELEVVDDLVRNPPDGVVGRARIRNPGVISGYVDDAQATGERFVGGWFQPGDLVSRTSTGLFAYHGRADQMMIVNGINLYPAEIESCLTAHPAVADAAALPLPHPVHQDLPICAVALHHGREASADALQAFARERLGFRAPARIYVIEAIPRNPQGKLVRTELIARLRGVA